MRAGRWSLVVAVGVFLGTGCDGGTDPESPPPPENLIGPAGGTITVENLTLDVPAGALTAEVEITAQRITPASGAAPGDYLVVEGTAFDLGPDGLAFQEPAQLTLAFDAADVPPGVSPTELAILQRNGSVGPLKSTVDANASVVRASLEHFSDVVVGMPEGDYQRVACPDLSEAAMSGLPLDRVGLGRVPTTFEPPLLARVEDYGDAGDGEPSHTFTLVELDDTSGEAELVVPIHPSTSPDGGETRMLVTDGTLACAPFDFTVEAMTPAPGELAAIAGHVQDILREQAAVLGTSPEEIVATPADDLPAALLPLAVVQSTLEHPGNDRSLTAIAAGATPGGVDTRLDLVEPLLARTGLRQELAVAAAEARQALATSGSLNRFAPAAVDADFCTPVQVGTDAGKLNECMELAWHEAFRRHGASGKVLGDLGDAFSVAGVAPGLGAPAAIAGFVAWFMANQTERNAARLPSVLTGLTIEYGPEEFLEDEGETGFWTNAQLTASNLSWDLGKEVLEGLLQAADVVGAFDKVQISPTQISDVMSYILTNPVANEYLEGGTIEDFQVPSQTFGPVNATSDQWTESKIATGDAVELTSHTDYEPRRPGTATLSVRTEDGEFGGQQRSDQAEISVKQLRVNISPDEVRLEAGEPQDFNVTVTDSKHPEMIEVDPSVALQGTVEEIAYIADGLHIVSYTAPAEPDPDQPDLLTVRHTAESGARGHSTEERNAIATIRFAEITISPRSACLDLGEERQFTAEVKGLDDETVVWSADVGTIDEDTGFYTAPPDATPGTLATITATSVSHPDVDDSVTITIGGCSLCRYDLTLAGGVTGGGEGPAGFAFDGSVLELGLDGDLIQDTPGDRIHSGFDATWNGEPGTFPVTYGSVANRSTDGWALYDPGDPVADCASCGGTVTIDEVTDEFIVGSLQVILSTITPDPDLPPTTATATFRAALITPDSQDVDPFRACVSEWR